MADRLIRREDRWPLVATAFVLGVSAAWWSFALWTVPGAPAWVDRARSVCFNLTESGLPDVTGWMLLLGEPPLLAGMLWVGWRREMASTLRQVLSHGAGRALVASVVVLVVGGLGMAGRTVAGARILDVEWGMERAALAATPRVDRAWPDAAGLVDQSGRVFAPASLGGRPALVTFAFGHCTTLCPVVVHQVREARAALDASTDGVPPLGGWSIVVLTVDPWRDTPSRLSPLLGQWGLDSARDFVLGGSVEAVNAALEAWNVPTARDERTGDVTHPGVAYLVEPDGTVAYVSTGGVERLVSLGERVAAGLEPAGP
jgi:protein SCO1/2